MKSGYRIEDTAVHVDSLQDMGSIDSRAPIIQAMVAA
eukprot:COSAG02_NODE_45112_length_360_cov_0.743295_2_plen_36_part_01